MSYILEHRWAPQDPRQPLMEPRGPEVSLLDPEDPQYWPSWPRLPPEETLQRSHPCLLLAQVAPCQISWGGVTNMQWRYLRAAPRYLRPRPLSVQPSLGPTAGQWCIGNAPTGDATLPHTNQSIRSPSQPAWGSHSLQSHRVPGMGGGSMGRFLFLISPFSCWWWNWKSPQHRQIIKLLAHRCHTNHEVNIQELCVGIINNYKELNANQSCPLAHIHK